MEGVKKRYHGMLLFNMRPKVQFVGEDIFLHSLPVLGAVENVSAELKFNQLRETMKVFQLIW